MGATGIVAEYNPFHKGHQYHMEETLRQHPSDGVVVVMSGNFTQRGSCALYDKWTRAEMALHCGADLVLELPVCFATRSAAYFAEGAVLSLAATGVVDSISCGVETPDIQSLQSLATFLCEEPEDYRHALHKALDNGLSFPSARLQALEQTCPVLDVASVTASPNNILALHYLQFIQKHRLPVNPILIHRKGDYHEDAFPEDATCFAGATAIRKAMATTDRTWQQHVPREALEVIIARQSAGIPPMELMAFDRLLIGLLRRSNPTELMQIPELGEGLENRILEASGKVQSIEALTEAVKSKRYTYTRIQRHLLHFLLNMTASDCFSQPTYLRILGFNQKGRALLKEMRKKSTLPIITRPAAQQKLLTESGRKMLALDCRATDLYYMGYPDPSRWEQGLDFTRQPIQIP